MKDKSALLIIDFQNVYLSPNKWACERIDDAIKNTIIQIKKFDTTDIFFTKFISPTSPKGTWQKYNNKYENLNTDYLNDYVKELKPFIENNLYSKNTFSLSSNKELLEILNKYETVYVAGVQAEVCIISSCLELIDMGIKVVYLKDCIAGKSVEKEKAVIEIFKSLPSEMVEII